MGRFRKWFIVLALLTVCAVVVLSPPRPPGLEGRLRLPVGNITPSVSIGWDYGLILASDGSLWSWGVSPALGLGSITNQPNLRQIGKDTDWRSISAGFRYSLAIKSDGSVWGWGENDSGQLGDGTFVARRNPVRSVPGNDWKQVSAGFDYSLGIKQDGTLWFWGNESPPPSGATAVKAGPAVKQVGSATNWTKVCSDAVWRTVGMQSDGSIWMLVTRSQPPTRLLPGNNWVDFGSGTKEVLAIRSDGTLWVFGSYANVLAGAPVELPVQVGTNTDWKAVCGGEEYLPLLKKNGEIWMLDVRALGLEHGRPQGMSPAGLRRIDLRVEVAAFGSGFSDCAAILTPQGEVWTWGAVLGERSREKPTLEAIARYVDHHLGGHAGWGQSREITFDKPWQLHNVDPDDPSGKAVAR